MAGTGTATLDFGTVPGSNSANVAVTGQTGITTDSNVEAWMMADSTTDHNAVEHRVVALTLVVGDLVADTGFTIYAHTDLRLTGTFKVRWVWA